MKLITATVLLLTLLGGMSLRPSQAQAASKQDSQTIRIARSGTQPSQEGATDRFTGSVRIEPLFVAKEPSRTSGASVTFEPGARSAWHTHPLGQVLIVTAGIGRVQSWGGPVEEFRKGDVVRIPPDLKHWHGASPGASMTHIAIQEEIGGVNVVWMEKVSDEQYRKQLSGTQGEKDMQKEPSTIKRNFGGFSPKLVQLTDDVLFGDVWERPELAKRDRSLITVAALVAGGNAEQLPFHLSRARENGLTEAELVETSPTWPSTAAGPKRCPRSRSPRRCSKSSRDSIWRKGAPSGHGARSRALSGALGNDQTD